MRFKTAAVICIASAIVAATAAPLRATPQADVVSTIHQFIDGFNRGDVKNALAACAPQVAIVDEFPPHSWQGRNSCAIWAADYVSQAKRLHITDGQVTLARPSLVSVTGDRAYVVMPARYAYKLRGKPVVEPSSIFTVALRRSAAGWRITGWAWAKR